MTTRSERFADKSLNDRHSRILKDLMMRSDNRRCADCKKKDPRWASWNIGIFVCIRCSGIHRSMGTHISKVKSADLDAWTAEQIENMVRWGNHKANVYWEHQLPPNFAPPET
ncbi:Arf GTPase activating protein [Zopfochytrium polystomum]|nr:Arf GTPase activating protein [Zopfochytrium polystomum]